MPIICYQCYHECLDVENEELFFLETFVQAGNIHHGYFTKQLLEKKLTIIPLFKIHIVGSSYVHCKILPLMIYALTKI